MSRLMGRSVAVLFSLVLLAAPPAPSAQENEPEPFQGLYLLSFNRWGDLENPAERSFAINELREHPEVDQIVLFSYGWANDGEASYATYRSTLEEIISHIPPRPDAGRTAIIAVAWDSSQTGFRKLFNDILPLPGVADALAWLPDKILFPISFWSKAAQADRIGYGGLRSAMNQIFEAVYRDGRDPPEIFLIGHSFGTRILSGLMRERLGPVAVRSERFVGAEHVRGAVLLQPALAYANLDTDANYPVLATMSAHDSANGLLFPIANIPFNTFSFTMFEALLRKQVLEPLDRGVGATMGRVTGVVTAPLPRRAKQVEETPGAESEPEAEKPKRLSRARYLARRTLAEIISIPASLAFSLISAPVTYAYTQVRGLVTRPFGHIMDSLAVIPVVQIPVRALDGALGREVRWGQRSKGIFTIGVFHESVGRMIVPLMRRQQVPLYSAAEIGAFDRDDSACGLPTCEGIFVVDATRIVREGGFGENLETPLVDFTIGWLDLIGAHGDYKNEDVVDLMARVIRQKRESRR
jgi:pimeloyl-ACP methyl ester carboxylesterase